MMSYQKIINKQRMMGLETFSYKCAVQSDICNDTFSLNEVVSVQQFSVSFLCHSFEEGKEKVTPIKLLQL